MFSVRWSVFSPDYSPQRTQRAQRNPTDVSSNAVNWTEQQQTSYVSSNLFFSVSSVFSVVENFRLDPAALAAKIAPRSWGNGMWRELAEGNGRVPPREPLLTIRRSVGKAMIGRFRHFSLFLFVALLSDAARAGDWADQRQVGRFQLYANFSLDESKQLVAELEQLEHDMATALGLKTTREPIHLILFRDQASYDRYMEHYFHGAPARRAMFIKGSMPGWVFAYQNADYEIDLRHESAHALLHSELPTVPLWLDEGLAEYYEAATNDRVYDNPYLSATKWDAWLFRVPPLRELQELQDVSRMGEAEYRAAWSWVHFMLHGPQDAQRVLVEYLADIREHRAPGNLDDRLHAAIPDLEKQYLKHFRSWCR